MESLIHYSLSYEYLAPSIENPALITLIYYLTGVAISLQYLYVIQISQNILPANSNQRNKQPKIYLLKSE